MSIILSNEHQMLVAAKRSFVRLLLFREQKSNFIDRNFVSVALKVFFDVGRWELGLAVADHKQDQIQM